MSTCKYSDYASSEAQEEAQEIVNRTFPWKPSRIPPRPQQPLLGEVATLEEIGNAIGGVSKERVRQILNHALWKAKRWAEREGYRIEDLL